MKKLIPLFALAILAFSHCKKEDPTPPSPQTNNFIGFWTNYDHFVYQHVLDTLFRDTNQFIMFDLEVENSNTLKRQSHAGGASLTYSYTRSNSELILQVSGGSISYRIAKLTEDSLILESKPGPTGGIPLPQDDKDIWYFVK